MADTRWQVCGGFDGSTSSDWTGIRLETLDGFQFTPLYGPDKRPTIWKPTEWGGRIPRNEVRVALRQIFTTFSMERFYCDPHDWQTEIEEWAIEFGAEHVFEWDTGRGLTRVPQVHEACSRYLTDLDTGALKHDGCPDTEICMANARKVAKPAERYVLGKPGNEHQKIDMAVCSVICHKAACDARAAGWSLPQPAELTVWR